jgi:outer membrane protein TolC
MKLPALWSGVDAKSEVGASQGAKTDLAEWWRSFDDSALNEVVEQALASNLDEKIAISRIREERAYLASSRGALLPSIGLDGSYTRQRYSANTPFGEFPQAIPREEDMYEAGFDASWEWKPRKPSLPHRSRTPATYA